MNSQQVASPFLLQAAAFGAYLSAGIFLFNQTFFYSLSYYIHSNPMGPEAAPGLKAIDDGALALVWLAMIPLAAAFLPRHGAPRPVVALTGIFALGFLGAASLGRAYFDVVGSDQSVLAAVLLVGRLAVGLWLIASNAAALVERRVPAALGGLGVLFGLSLPLMPQVMATPWLILLFLAGLPTWQIWLGQRIKDGDIVIPAKRIDTSVWTRHA